MTNTGQAQMEALLASSWVKTNAPVVMRNDDIWFLDGNNGWTVNCHGQILKTTDAGDHWTEQFHVPDIWLRCIGFATDQIGWVGTVGGRGDDGAPTLAKRLLATRDGGASWAWVDLPAAVPGRICGLSVADATTIYLSGTNNPAEPPGLMKSSDGGTSWQAIPMAAHASMLIDVFFRNASEGWVVGGRDALQIPGRVVDRNDMIPVVLHTSDGGATWTNLAGAPDLVRQFPRGEWGWKIQFLPPSTLVVALENERDGAILRSDDNGATWARLKINDAQRNSNLEGIGFLTPEIGWIGGWGDQDGITGATSATSDGGLNWRNANEVGRNLNRFRFIGDPVHSVFASGDGVYRLAPGQTAVMPPATPRTVPADPYRLDFTIPAGAGTLLVTVWNRFGSLVRTLADSTGPAAGATSIAWDIKDAAGNRVPPGPHFIRVTIDQTSFAVLLAVSHAGAAATLPAHPAASPTPPPGGHAPATPGFAADIRPLFRDFDRQAMVQAFDLFDYATVKARAGHILQRLADGTMPCDARWDDARIALFRRWMDSGMAP